MIRKHRITLAPTTTAGAGLNAATQTLTLGRPGFVRAIAVDHQASGATTDLVIKADSASGVTLFTATSSATDIPAKPVGMPAIDETGAAVAATDASSGGFPFGTGLYFSGDQIDDAGVVVVDVWLET